MHNILDTLDGDNMEGLRLLALEFSQSLPFSKFL